MEEYKFEGIALEDITFDDNSDVLNSLSIVGGLPLLNEESVRPKGSDKEFVYC
jgi:myosin heavy subunit